MARDEIPCLYCNETYEFIAGMHLKTHFDGSDAFDEYKQWLAEEHDLDLDHEVFHTAGALTRPEEFEEYEYLFS